MSCLLSQARLSGETGVVGACLAGSVGKTTTSWLIRGIFEEWGKLTGMAGTIENAIYADKLDAEGNLWTPDEPDPTLDRQAFLKAVSLGPAGLLFKRQIESLMPTNTTPMKTWCRFECQAQAGSTLHEAGDSMRASEFRSSPLRGASHKFCTICS